MIINVGKKRKPQNSEKIELTKHIEPAKKAYLSYINEEGNEIMYNGPYNKHATGYSFTYNQTKEYDIIEETINTYSSIESHFTYIDKDGYERTFNKLDTLEFNEELNTYTGEIDIVNYEDKEVTIFEE